MAYFDSSKNRALWKRELAGLMEEKERRLREGYEPASQKVSKKSDYANNPFRQKITFEQLQQEELEARGKRMKSTERTATRQREYQAEQQAPVMKGKRL